MIVSISIALFALLSMVLMLRTIRGYEKPVRSVQELISRTLPVDLESFRNLTNVAEENFLRSNLKTSEFRALQRERSRAALVYVRRTSHNAALLLRVGEAARRHSNPRIAAAAQELIDSALQLRMFSVLSVCLLYLRILAPGIKVSPHLFVARYEHLRDSMAGFVRLQLPASASQVDAAL